MTEVFEKLHAAIAKQSEKQVMFLRALVQAPTDNPPGDTAAHAEVAAARLAALGFEVERHSVPESMARECGMVSATNLIVRRTFGAEGSGPTIALNAHGDVVPPGEGWTVDPYGGELRDGELYGRGAAVSKSDFATYAFALLALEEVGGDLSGSVELHLTYDEEVGGEIGPKWLLVQGLTKPNLAICAGFSYGIVNAHNGCLHLETTVRGKIAHAALPDRGHDALEATHAILGALYQHRKGLAALASATEGIDSPTLVIGLIKGGINTNVVPDTVSFRLDRRMIPEEDPTVVEAELKTLIADSASAFDGISCEVKRLLLAQTLVPLSGHEKLASEIARHGERVFGEPISTHGVPLYTDARHYAEAGIPTVLYGCGPRSIEEAGAHGADEHVRIDDLSRATEVVACTLYSLLDGA